MHLPFSFSSVPLHRHLLLAGICVVLPFVACTTTDPVPGQPSEGSTSSGSGGRSGSGSGGRVDFGEGGDDSTDGETSDSADAGDGDSSGDGDTEGETEAGDGDPGDGDGDSGDTGGPVQSRACGDAPVVKGDFSKKRLLESAGVCAAYHTCRFSNTTVELGRKVTSYVGNPTEDSLAKAREAWLAAMDAYALTAPDQYGPIASVASDKYHGRGIGAFLHSWPGLNRCEIEKQVATRTYEEQGFQSILPSARGLPALEYLLFYEGDDTICSANSGTGKAWAALSADDIAQGKRDYALAAVEDLYLKSEELVNVWSEDGENFGATLADNEGYESQQEALNIVGWSLLYPYHEIRDLQIGPLAGIGDALHNPVSPYAHADLLSIRTNLKAFRALFQGCGAGGEGIGFDDWLKDVGAEDLSQDILQALDDIERHAAILPPLHESSTEQMAAFYADLKVLSDLLKGQLFGSGSVLNLKLPASAASDTD